MKKLKELLYISEEIDEAFIEQKIKEFVNKFPNKLAEVIDDFGSSTKSELRDFIAESIQQAVAEERKKFRFLDVCHDYKTKEQFEMFISAREEDIDSIKLSIKDAKVKIKTLQK